MDKISKFIAVCAFLFPMALLHTLESDVNEIESKDQIVLNAIESVLIAEDTKHKKYFDDMKYTPEIGAQNLGRKFNIQYDLSAKELSNISQYEYFIIAPIKNKKTKAYLHYDGCKKEEAVISWEDGVANKITYKNKSYMIGYNEAGLVRTLTENNNDKDANRKRHVLLYTDDKKIESVSTSLVSNDGVAKNDELKISETSYRYADNKIDITHKVYDGQQMALPSNTNKTEYITFVLEDLSLTRINYRSNDRTIIDSVDETILNESGQITRKVHSIAGQGNSSVDSYEYNELGHVLKSSSLVANAENIISHKESLYSYSVRDTADLYKPKCEQYISMIHSTYDEEGNLANTYRETTF